MAEIFGGDPGTGTRTKRASGAIERLRTLLDRPGGAAAISDAEILLCCRDLLEFRRRLDDLRRCGGLFARLDLSAEARILAERAAGLV